MSDEDFILGVEKNANKVSDLVIKTIKNLIYFKWSQTTDSFIKIKILSKRKQWKDPEALLKRRQAMEKEISVIQRMKPYYAYLTAPNLASKKMCIEYSWGILKKQEAEGFVTDARVVEDRPISKREEFEYTFKQICEKFEKEIINGVTKTRVSKLNQRKRQR